MMVLLAFCFPFLALVSAAPLRRPARPNVLFIIADDMRPQLGAYGQKYMHTPHLDKLAATGTRFNRAYVQYAFCAPSRNRRLSSITTHSTSPNLERMAAS